MTVEASFEFLSETKLIDLPNTLNNSSCIDSIAYSPINNCLIFVTDQNQVYFADAVLDHISAPTSCKSSSSIHLAFSNEHKCLMIRNGRLLNTRRDMAGTYFLQTALQQKFPVGKSAQADTEVQIEMTFSEASQLLEYMSSPVVRLKSDSSHSVLESLKSQLKDLEKPLQHRFRSVLVESSYEFLHRLFNTMMGNEEKSAARKMPKKGCIVALGSSLLERLNLINAQPYPFELNLSGTGFNKSTMVSEAARRMTMAKWPHPDLKWCTGDRMAEAGLYFTPSASCNDRVSCFCCNLYLSSWEPCDEPWLEHERHMPSCLFISGEQTANVPISVTYANSTAMENGSIDEIYCHGEAKFCEWLATGTPKGHLSLWNIAKDLKKAVVKFNSDSTTTGLILDQVSLSHFNLKPLEEPIKNRHWSNEKSKKVPNLNLTALCTIGSDKNDGVKKLACLIVGCEVEDKSINKKLATNTKESDTSSYLLVYGIEPVKDLIKKQTTPQKPAAPNCKVDASKKKAIFATPGSANGPMSAYLFGNYEEPTAEDLEMMDVLEYGESDEYYDDDMYGADGAADETMVSDASFLVGGEMDYNKNAASLVPPSGFGGASVPNPLLASAHAASMAPIREDDYKVEYKAPELKLQARKAVQLPPEYAAEEFRIHSITPCLDGSEVFVALNRKANRSDDNAICSVVLAYSVSIVDKIIFGISDQPSVIIRLTSENAKSSIIKNVLTLKNDTSTNQDILILLLENGILLAIIDGQVSAQYFDKSCSKMTEKMSHIVHTSETKLVACMDSGRIVLLDFVQNRKSIQANTTAIDLDGEPELNAELLKQLYKMTKSSPVRITDLPPAWSVVTPAAWIDVQQRNAQATKRRGLQHNGRDAEKVTRSWHIVCDRESWKEHLFEISIGASVPVSHLDFNFSLRSNSYTNPKIKATLLYRAPKSADSPVHPAEPSSENFGPISALKLCCESVNLSSCLSNDGKNGLIQFRCPEFLLAKTRTFFLHIQSSEDINNSFESSKKHVAVHRKVSRLCQDSLSADKTSDSFKSMPVKFKKISKFSSVAPVKCDFRGCDLLQEISLTLFQTDSLLGINDWGIKVTSLYSKKILETLIDCLQFNKSSPDPKHDPYDHRCDVILEILFFSIAGLYNESQQVMEIIGEKLTKLFKSVTKSVFSFGSRSTVKKFTSFFIELFSKMASEKSSEFLAKIKPNLSDCLPFVIFGGRSASQLIWFNILVEFCFNMSPCEKNQYWQVAMDHLKQMCQISNGQKLNFWNKQLAEKYGLLGCPFEAPVFETSIRKLVTSSKAHRYNYISYANAVSNATSVVTTFDNELDSDFADWSELLPSMTSSSMTSSNNYNWDEQQQQSIINQKRIRTIDREHLNGLIEVEPLDFAVLEFSEGVQIDQSSNQCSTAHPYANNAAMGDQTGGFGGGMTSSQTPQQQQTIQLDNLSAAMPVVQNAVMQMKQQVQNLLSQQMHLMGAVDNAIAAGVADSASANAQHLNSGASEPISITQASSASTYGNPTTPKTTPFMTPTPLSPYQGSPSNSAAPSGDASPKLAKASSHLVSITTDEEGDDIDDSIDEQVRSLQSKEVVSTVMSFSNMNQPLPLTLLVQRLDSGARKFVVLDFGRPILLTDLIIPQCCDVETISIDCWLQKESVDSFRLLHSSALIQKTIIMSDVQTPVYFRYMKITYIAKYGLGACLSRLPVGLFYGHSIIDAWQLENVMSADRINNYDPIKTNMAAAIDFYKQQIDIVHCSYDSACCRLQKLLENNSTPSNLSTLNQTLQKNDEILHQKSIFKTYHECMRFKVQLARLKMIGLAKCQVDSSLKDYAMEMSIYSDHVIIDFYGNMSIDKLNVCCEILLKNLLTLNKVDRNDRKWKNENPIDLDLALNLFEHFFAVENPKLQILWSCLLLRLKKSSNWWADFIERILIVIKNGNGDKEQKDSMYRLLTFMSGHLINWFKSPFVYAILQKLIRMLKNPTDLKDDNDPVRNLLTLLSTSFDQFSAKKICSDRWDFFSTVRKTTGQKINKKDFFNQSTDPKCSTNTDPSNQSVSLYTASQFGEIASIPSHQSGVYCDHDANNSSMSMFYNQQSIDNPSVTSSKKSSSKNKDTLQLPAGLCTKVARLLLDRISIGLDPDKQNNDANMATDVLVVFCKLLSTICQISLPKVQLYNLFGQEEQSVLLQLVSKACLSDNTLIRQALTCLLQYFMKIERHIAKVVVKQQSSSTCFTTSKKSASISSAPKLARKTDIRQQAKSDSVCSDKSASVGSKDDSQDSTTVIDSSIDNVVATNVEVAEDAKTMVAFAHFENQLSNLETTAEQLSDLVESINSVIHAQDATLPGGEVTILLNEESESTPSNADALSASFGPSSTMSEYTVDSTIGSTSSATSTIPPPPKTPETAQDARKMIDSLIETLEPEPVNVKKEKIVGDDLRRELFVKAARQALYNKMSSGLQFNETEVFVKHMRRAEKAIYQAARSESQYSHFLRPDRLMSGFFSPSTDPTMFSYSQMLQESLMNNGGPAGPTSLFMPFNDAPIGATQSQAQSTSEKAIQTTKSKQKKSHNEPKSKKDPSTSSKNNSGQVAAPRDDSSHSDDCETISASDSDNQKTLVDKKSYLISFDLASKKDDLGKKIDKASNAFLIIPDSNAEPRGRYQHDLLINREFLMKKCETIAEIFIDPFRKMICDEKLPSTLFNTDHVEQTKIYDNKNSSFDALNLALDELIRDVIKEKSENDQKCQDSMDRLLIFLLMLTCKYDDTSPLPGGDLSRKSSKMGTQKSIENPINLIQIKNDRLESLIDWFCDKKNTCGSLWLLLWRLMCFLLGKKAIRGCTIDDFLVKNKEKLAVLFTCFFESSQASEIDGPVMSRTFANVLQSIVSSSPLFSDELCTLLIDCLAHIFEKKFPTTTTPPQLATESLNKLVKFLDMRSMKELNLPKFTRLVASYSQVVKMYLENCPSSRQAYLPNGSRNPRFCSMPWIKGLQQNAPPPGFGNDVSSNSTTMNQSDLQTAVSSCKNNGQKDLTIGAKTRKDECESFLTQVAGWINRMAEMRVNNLAADFGENVIKVGWTGSELDDENTTTVAEKLTTYSSNIVENLIRALSFCFSDCKSIQQQQKNKENILNKNRWVLSFNRTALADTVFDLLVNMFGESKQADRLIQAVLVHLNYKNTNQYANGGRNAISEPLMVLLCNMVSYSDRTKAIFANANGLVVLVQRFISCSTHNTMVTSPAGSSIGFLTTIHNTNNLEEQKKNYAPQCTVSSSSPMAHQLKMLVQETSGKRRSRTANWSYHFYPAESWLDVTLQLPLPIQLSEISIRPLASALQNTPGAVQVELSPDNDPRSFSLIGPTVKTAGCTLIKIDTEIYPFATKMVRLHFQRPDESSNLNLSQIILSGSATSDWKEENVVEKANLLEALSYCAQQKSVFEKLIENIADLTQLLIKNLLELVLFGCHPLRSYHNVEYCLFYMKQGAQILKQTMQMIDCRNSLTHIDEGEVWISDIIYKLVLVDFSSTSISIMLTWIKTKLSILIGTNCGTCSESVKSILWLTSQIVWSIKDVLDIYEIQSVLSLLIDIYLSRPALISQADFDKKAGCLVSSICHRFPNLFTMSLKLRSNFDQLFCDVNEKSSLSINQLLSRLVVAVPDIKLITKLADSWTCSNMLLDEQIVFQLAICINRICLVSIENDFSDFDSKPKWDSFAQLMKLLSTLCQPYRIPHFILDEKCPPNFLISILRFLSKMSQHCSADFTTYEIYDDVITMLKSMAAFNDEIQEKVCRAIVGLLRTGGWNGFAKLLVSRVLLEHQTTKALIEPFYFRDAASAQPALTILHPEFGFHIDKCMKDLALDDRAHELISAKLNSVNDNNENKITTDADNALKPDSFVLELKTLRAYILHPPNGSLCLSIAHPILRFAKLGGLVVLAPYLIGGDNQSSSSNNANIEIVKQKTKVEPTLHQSFTDSMLATSYVNNIENNNIVDVMPQGGLGSWIESKKPMTVVRPRDYLAKHVIGCLASFLNFLPGFAEALVEKDCNKTRLLLRLGFGEVLDENGANILTICDGAALSALPFDVLALLLRRYYWSHEDGICLRRSLAESGVLYNLLSHLSSFTSDGKSVLDVTSTDAKNTTSVVKPKKGSPKKPHSSSYAAAASKTAASSALATFAQLPNNSEMFVKSENQFWAKGTGFGSGSTQAQWNIDQHVLKQRRNEENIMSILKILTNFIDPLIADTFNNMDNPNAIKLLKTEKRFDELISRFLDNKEENKLTLKIADAINNSCLSNVLESYLSNDSVLDISRHPAVYFCVLEVLCAIALCSHLRPILLRQQNSLQKLLAKLKQSVDIYVSKLGIAVPAFSTNSFGDGVVEESLLKISLLIDVALQIIGRENEAASTTCAELPGPSAILPTIKAISDEDVYMAAMKPIQYASIKFFEEAGSGRMALPFHYESSIKGSGFGQGGVSAPRIRRLAQEITTLATSLPLSLSSSVFARCAEERLDAVKILITGPHGTPYQDGCFEFDVWFPDDYPQMPMHINLETTGNNTVRFNPNLYNDGKVCLSILNTWHGRPEERWNAQTSSFLQVLVSIQSLILVQDPYFNEPGYERMRHTPEGQRASKDYDMNIKAATVRWGILEAIRNPPVGFEEVVKRHFWLKKADILELIDKWIEDLTCDMETLSNDKRLARSTVVQNMKRYQTCLKEEFAKMTCPLGCKEDNIEDKC